MAMWRYRPLRMDSRHVRQLVADLGPRAPVETTLETAVQACSSFDAVLFLAS